MRRPSHSLYAADIFNIRFSLSNYFQGSNPDFGTQDLFEAIEAKNYPSWTVYIQALSPKAAETFKCERFHLQHTITLTKRIVLCR